MYIYKSTFLFFLFLTSSFSQLNAQCTAFNLLDDFGCVDQGDDLTVTWTSTGCAAGQDVYLSLIDIAANVSVASWFPLVNDGSEMVTIPATLPPGDYRFYIQNYPWPPDAWNYGIDFQVKAIVPVIWESFSGKENPRGGVDLEWSTASEINNAGFEIQKSLNSISWERLDFVEADVAGVSGANYFFTDRKTNSGMNFYRLKQIDFDGQYEYSEILQITIRNSALETFSMYPNPTSHYLNFNRAFEPHTPYFISNIQGEVVQRGTVDADNLNVEFLNSGIYSIHIMDRLSPTITSFIKE